MGESFTALGRLPATRERNSLACGGVVWLLAYESEIKKRICLRLQPEDRGHASASVSPSLAARHAECCERGSNRPQDDLLGLRAADDKAADQHTIARLHLRARGDVGESHRIKGAVKLKCPDVGRRRCSHRLRLSHPTRIGNPPGSIITK